MGTRRDFTAGLASLAFGGLALANCSALRKAPDVLRRAPGFRERRMGLLPHYQPLVEDRSGLLDLPPGFEYEVVAWSGKWKGQYDRLDDGKAVPDSADGMGSFDLGGGQVVLVRNHESTREGGTTTIVYDCERGVRKAQYRSLSGTRRNCAGGVTPWGTWLSCEEDLTVERLADGTRKKHGFVYQVPAIGDGTHRRRPLEHLGRFNHEAAAVDPRTRIIYMTEDQIDGLFYRYRPPTRERPTDPGGRLEALAFADPDHGTDSRNWGNRDWPAGTWRDVVWKALDVAQGETDGLRRHGHRDLEAVRFACGEGIHFGDGELYFTVTSGGPIKSGQIMRYRPDPVDNGRGRIQLFLESTDPGVFNFADNLAVAPGGHLVVCEDPYWGGEKTYLPRMIDSSAPCYLRGVSPDGGVYNIARLRNGSELAGACFSPNGEILFLNVYSPGITLAIRGEWQPGPRECWNLYPAQGVDADARCAGEGGPRA
jgi:secreted PhoX family phosphatase